MTLALVVWAATVAASEAVDADAERVHVPDGGTLEPGAREVAVLLDGGGSRP